MFCIQHTIDGQKTVTSVVCSYNRAANRKDTEVVVWIGSDLRERKLELPISYEKFQQLIKSSAIPDLTDENLVLLKAQPG